jgi:hypothetical protein
MLAFSMESHIKAQYLHQHMERSFTMRQINKKHLVDHLLWTVVFTVLLPSCTFGDVRTTGRDIWNGYSPEQKKLAIAGFVHCYRSASSRNDAFAQTENAAAIRMIDQAVKNDAETVGNLVLQALTKAPNAKPDVHAEHWTGPYGFASGLWWRGLDDQDREAYVQGVFWCAETDANVAVNIPEKSVREAVKKLNDWYVVSDDDWKDPRSNARVDVPAVVAMQWAEVVAIKHAKMSQ